jgi:SAM-dependent methyltransferase
MQYEVLDGIQVPGTVLDIGGTHDPRKPYKQLLKGHTKWVVLNIAHYQGEQPYIQADCNQRLPVADNFFDNVLAFNSMEHVYRMEFAVEEMVRVLKPGGKLLLNIPFLYSVHGVPDDFHRPTASWWQTKFEQLNIMENNVKIMPLLWCTLSSGISLMDNKWSRVKRRVLRPLYLFPALFRRKIGKGFSCLDRDTPLGYFIEVTK